MRHSVTAAAVILAVLSQPATAQTAKPQRFDHATAGFSIARPAGWQTGALQQVQESRKAIRLADPELQAAVQTLAAAPLFVFWKYPEPNPELNPTIEVQLRPIGPLAGSAPKVLMRVAIGPIRKAVPDFTYVTDISDVRVSGHPAAYMKAKFTVTTNEGRDFKTLVRMWLVPRGAFMFLISMSGPQEGKDVSESEFEAALASITIEK